LPASSGREDAARALRRLLTAQRLCEPGATLLLAVSGGPDSAGLLAAATALPPGERPRLVAAHVDHHLQPGSAGVASAVAAQAARLGVPCTGLQLEPVPGEGGPVGAEAWARAGRYRLLERFARTVGADALVTAHHREDQVETFLLRLLRHAGTRGRAAMRARRPLPGGLPLLRPFLGLSRTRLREAANLAGLEDLLQEDPSNTSVRYLRNRIRLELLPELERTLGPELSDSLLEIAGLCARVDALLEEEVDRRAAGCLRATERGCLLRRRSLIAAAPAVQAALLLRLLHRLHAGHEPRRVHGETLRRLACTAPPAGHPGPRRWCLPGGVSVKITRDYMEFDAQLALVRAEVVPASPLR